MSITIERAAAADTRPLRLAILRPGQPPESADYDGDEDPSTWHLVARTPNAEVVATTSVFRNPAPLDESRPAWQMRGVTTAPSVRGTGLGLRLMATVEEEVARHGGGILWCNGRLTALGFYEKLGFVSWGAEFEHAGVPHIVLWREIPPAPTR